jgi:hypothetical protein
MAMTTGLEPAPSTLTGWCTGLLCYVTTDLALWHLDSNQEARGNLRSARLPLTDARMKCHALPSSTGRGARRAFVAEAGFEPACVLVMSQGWNLSSHSAVAPDGFDPSSPA